MDNLTEPLLELANRVAGTPALRDRHLDDPMFLARLFEAAVEVLVITDSVERSSVIKSHVEQLLQEFPH